MWQAINNIITARVMRAIAWIIIIAGGFARIYIYLQNRNLIIDESNLAHNIYERGFIGLTQPLSYEQYAPPIFLWITKLNSILFGFSEQALRLYPLLCGLLALIMLYQVLKEYIHISTIWYPLSLFAFAHIMIRYSSELKQYMPDVLITLLLIYAALKINILKTKAARFIILWAALGSLSIWASMPSVFILSGIGAYYFWHSVKAKNYKKILPIITVSVIWLAQFGWYYFTILKAQANSGYLQGFHQQWFLYATPDNGEQWQHNYDVFNLLMFQFEGMYHYVHTFNLAFIISGTILLFTRAGAKACLIVVPALLMLVAAALNQFSLIPRVALFGTTLLIIIVGFGFGQMAGFRSQWLKLLFVALGIFCGYHNIKQALELDEFKYEEITTAMQFLDDKEIPGAAITVFSHSVPAFNYYTHIHPDSNRWERVKNADLYSRDADFDSLAYHMRFLWKTRRPLGFIYTNATGKELRQYNQSFKKLLVLQDSLILPYVQSYIYIKPLPQDTLATEKYR